MHDLQYNGGKQLHTATGLIVACTHKSALSSSQPTSQSTMFAMIASVSQVKLETQNSKLKVKLKTQNLKLKVKLKTQNSK